jgi:hypothetical protein
MILVLWRYQWIWAAVLSIRRQPYVAFALMYTGIFVVAFSGFANFGLLARERVQMFPLALVALAVPPPKEKEEARPRHARSAVEV